MPQKVSEKELFTESLRFDVNLDENSSRGCRQMRLKAGSIEGSSAKKTLKAEKNDQAKNANVRISMLCRGGAPGGVAGSSNDVCAVNLARFLSES
jgi:hypothetical protein